MPSTILSDNGALSGTSGVKTTGSNDGALQLQTTTTGGAATAALTIDTSQNVGIGTTSPQRKVHIVGASGAVASFPTVGASDSLVVENNASSNINLVANPANSSELKFTPSGASTPSGSILYNYANNYVLLSANGSEKMRLTSDGYLRMASGTGGIQFGGDTAAVNALDDYEEGTWTPTLSADTTAPTVTYSTQLGSYRKIGSQVIVEINLGWSGRSGGSGTAIIGGLPFQAFSHSPDTRAFEALAVWGGPNFTGVIFGIVGGSTTNIILYYLLSGNASAQDIGAMSTTGSVRGVFSYITG